MSNPHPHYASNTVYTPASAGDTVTLPRKLVEQAIVSLESWLTNSERDKAAEALRAALTKPEYLSGYKRALSDAALYVSAHCKDGDYHAFQISVLPLPTVSNSVEFHQIKAQARQNKLRSEYLINKHKTDWSAS